MYEMNETIINNWNQIVKKEDIIYHLGDFGFGSKEELQEIFDRLNGQKYLIMGNHDRKNIKYYSNLGFIEVYKTKYELDKYIFSHEPIIVPNNKINIYGHIHDKPIEPQFDDINHMCVCLERTEYKPLLLIDDISVKKRIRTKR
jgi:calcineurin-like phosphoesterase family protein